VAWRMYYQGRHSFGSSRNKCLKETLLLRVFSSATLHRLTTRTPSLSPCCSTTSSTEARYLLLTYIMHTNTFLDITAVHKAQPGWRRVIAQAVLWGIPTPAFSTALAFFDGYRSEIVPANLLQAQVCRLFPLASSM
jgi:hypothetical protein